MPSDMELSPADRVGMLLGLVAGGAASFFLPIGPAAAVLLCMGGPVIGVGIVRALSYFVPKRK